MISLKSLYNFFYINGLLVTMGTVQYLTINYSNNILFKFAITFLDFSFKNYFFVKFIDYNLRNRERIKNDVTEEEYENEFILAFLSSTLVETVTYMIITALLFHNSQINYFYDLLYFIPLSFVFEFIFDFFHYWTHRISHTNFFLYKYSHKSHHKYINPIPILTFYHNPVDLIITNSIPQILTLLIFPYLSVYQYNLILVYKSFIEVGGHSGKKIYPTSSFPQFIWLPKVLGIKLYTEDHHLHHYENNCNYAKRFSFWDKLFGTYKKHN